MNTTLDLSPIVISVFIVWTVIFLLSLADALTRNDFDPITRLTWVIVLIFVPFFGVLLYGLHAQRGNQQHPWPFGKRPSGSEVFGTPWANDPGHTQSDSKD